MKNIILFIIGALFSINAIALTQSGFVDISQNNIQLIKQSTNSRLMIYGVTMNDSTCDNNNTPVLFFSGNEIAKEMYSMILAAKTAGKQINFVGGDCVDLGGTYTSVVSVYMK